MIVWNLLFSTSLNAQYLTVDMALVKMFFNTLLLSATTVLYPIVGILTDSCIGRYKFLKAAMYINLVTNMAMALFHSPSDVLGL